MASQPTGPSIRLLTFAASLVAAATGASAAPEKAAVFDFQFSNLSPIAPDAQEHERLKRISDQLRDLLQKKGLYAIVSTDPVRDEVAKSADLRRCNGCAEGFAKTLGADAAITGEVQKVSNLIINLNVYVKQIKGDAPEKAYSVDLRGNTDESFERGIRYLVENNMGGGK